MVDVAGIDFTDGLTITIRPGHTIYISPDKITGGGSIANCEAQAEAYLQPMFEDKVATADIPDYDAPTHPIHANQRLEGDFIITTRVYVKIHIYKKNPLAFTVRCSQGPITGNWWE